MKRANSVAAEKPAKATVIGSAVAGAPEQPVAEGVHSPGVQSSIRSGAMAAAVEVAKVVAKPRVSKRLVRPADDCEHSGMLSGKKALVFGVANDHSIAWGIAKALYDQGAEVGFS